MIGISADKAWGIRALAAVLAALALGGCSEWFAQSGALPPFQEPEVSDAADYLDDAAGVGAPPQWDAMTRRTRGKVYESAEEAGAVPPAIALPCSGAAPKPDGSCCPADQSWSKAAAACVQVSGTTCAPGATCPPRWCFDWKLPSGGSCSPADADCSAQPRDCSAADLAAAVWPAGQSCASGTAPGALGCAAAAAAVAQPFGGAAAADVPLAAAALPAVPADLAVETLPALAAAAAPAWCLDAGGQVAGLCQEAKTPCKVGQWLDNAGTCVALAAALPKACPAGALAGEAPVCPPDPAECGSGKWGELPNAAALIYVDPAAAPGGNGSAASPLASLTAALAAAPSGTAVVLAAGSYAVPAGGLSVASGVTLRGRCAQLVQLQAADNLAPTLKVLGKVERVTVSGGSYALSIQAGGAAERLRAVGGSSAAVWLAGSLSDAVLLPTGQGVRVPGGAAQLARVRIDHATGRGLSVYGGAKVSASDLVVTATQPEKALQGHGLLVAEASQLSVQGLWLSGNASAAAVASDSGTSLQIQRFWIEKTAAAPGDSDGGQGILCNGGASTTALHGQLTGNQTQAVLVHGSGSSAVLGNVIATATLANPAGSTGEGLRVQSGGKLTVRGLLTSSNVARSAICSGAGSQLTLEGAALTTTYARPSDGKAGQGLVIDGGCTAQVQLLRLSANRTAGAVVAGQGSSLSGGEVVIDATQAQSSDGSQGSGLQVVEGAKVQLQSLFSSGNRSQGVLVADAGSSLSAGLLRVRDTLPRQKDGSAGTGVSVSDGAALVVQKLHLSGNRVCGLQVEGAGSSATVGGPGGGAVISAMLPSQSSDKGGWGASVSGGASLNLQRLHVVGARELALAASGTASQLELADAWISDTLAANKSGEMGRGLAIEAGAKAKIQRLVVTAARQVGVSVHGSELAMSDAYIGGTLPDQATSPKVGPGHYGRGLSADAGAQVQLLRVRLSGNREVGLAAYGGSQIRARHLTIDATAPQPAGSEGGRAIDVSGGAFIGVDGGLLRDHTQVAALVSGSQSLLDLRNVAVVQVAAAADATGGYGLYAGKGALLRTAGVSLVGTRYAAVSLDAAQGELYGLASGAIGKSAEDKGGYGVCLAHAASLKARGLQISGAHTSALLARDSALDIDSAYLQGTQMGAFSNAKQQAADGLTLVLSSAKVSNTLLQGHLRAGAVVSGGSAAFANVRLLGNGIGWSIQGLAAASFDAVSAAGNANSVWTGGALGLPPAVPTLGARWAIYPVTF